MNRNSSPSSSFAQKGTRTYSLHLYAAGNSDIQPTPVRCRELRHTAYTCTLQGTPTYSLHLYAAGNSDIQPTPVRCRELRHTAYTCTLQGTQTYSLHLYAAGQLSFSVTGVWAGNVSALRFWRFWESCRKCSSVMDVARSGFSNAKFCDSITIGFQSFKWLVGMATDLRTIRAVHHRSSYHPLKKLKQFQ